VGWIGAIAGATSLPAWSGEHSLRNIVIVCRACNGKKSALTYEAWIDRIDPQHRERVTALYQERYGELAVAA